MVFFSLSLLVNSIQSVLKIYILMRWLKKSLASASKSGMKQEFQLVEKVFKIDGWRGDGEARLQQTVVATVRFSAQPCLNPRFPIYTWNSLCVTSDCVTAAFRSDDNNLTLGKLHSIALDGTIQRRNSQNTGEINYNEQTTPNVNLHTHIRSMKSMAQWAHTTFHCLYLSLSLSVSLAISTYVY